jgi:hypothetical protein
MEITEEFLKETAGNEDIDDIINQMKKHVLKNLDSFLADSNMQD